MGSSPTPEVEILIQAAGRGDRLGLGDKAFVRLAGLTLLERAIAACSLIEAPMIVALPPGRLDDARPLCPPRSRLIEGDSSRSRTLRRLLAASAAPLLLLHDVVHPLAPPRLFPLVLAAAAQAGAAAAAFRPSEFVYRDVDGATALPGAIAERVLAAWVAQSPKAFVREFLERGIRTHGERLRDASGGDSGMHSDDPGALELVVLGGGRVATVAGEAENVKVTTPADLDWAARMLRG
jgi:2-C-methyl-D-erythritol 4-phosphate cytidylyltransferase